MAIVTYAIMPPSTRLASRRCWRNPIEHNHHRAKAIGLNSNNSEINWRIRQRLLLELDIFLFDKDCCFKSRSCVSTSLQPSDATISGDHDTLCHADVFCFLKRLSKRHTARLVDLNRYLKPLHTANPIPLASSTTPPLFTLSPLISRLAHRIVPIVGILSNNIILSFDLFCWICTQLPSVQ